MIEVVGTPIVISPSQLGILYNGIFPLYNIGQFMRNSPQITKTFKVTNEGPKKLQINWKIFNYSNQEAEVQYFEITVTPPLLGTNDFKLNFLPIEPPESMEGPFFVEPKYFFLLNQREDMILSREEKVYKIHFESKFAETFKAVLVGKPSIIYEAHDQPIEGVDLGLLTMQLEAQNIDPQLHIDKLVRKALFIKRNPKRATT
jgi:hypothetical protein